MCSALIYRLLLCRSIGVSNFNVVQLETLLAFAKVKPAAIQILYNRRHIKVQKPIVDYAADHGIVTEAYGVLRSITFETGGPIDAPVQAIADRPGAQPAQGRLTWAKAKGVVAIQREERAPGRVSLCRRSE